MTVASNAHFGGSRVITNSANLTGFQLGTDLTPELRIDGLSIYDWDGESASFFPTLGAQLFVGPRRSQFGNAEPLGYLLA